MFRSPVESLRTTVAILVSYNVFRLRPSKTIPHQLYQSERELVRDATDTPSRDALRWSLATATVLDEVARRTELIQDKDRPGRRENYKKPGMPLDKIVQ